MSIAESRSVRALGVACCSAIGELTGSPTVGLYLLEGAEPELVYSRHVEEGLLDNYKSGFWKCDPVLDCILTAGRTIDGASLLGPHHWPRSASWEMLHEWGFATTWAGRSGADRRSSVSCSPRRVMRRSLYDAGAAAHGDAVSRRLAGAHQHDECGQIDDDASAPIMLRTLPATVSAATLSARLPPRSADVAIRVCRGRTNKEIAREMGISDQTVKEHVANLCRRFGVHNRTELTACLLSPSARQ